MNEDENAARMQGDAGSAEAILGLTWLARDVTAGPADSAASDNASRLHVTQGWVDRLYFIIKTDITYIGMSIGQR